MENHIDPKVKLFLVDVDITVDNIPVYATNEKEAEEVAKEHFEEEMAMSCEGKGAYAKEIKDKAFLSKYMHDCIPYSDVFDEPIELTCKEFVELKEAQIQKEKDFAEADKKQHKFDFYDSVEKNK